MPLVGEIASLSVETIGKFINNIDIKRNAKEVLKFAVDLSDLSQKASLLAK